VTGVSSKRSIMPDRCPDRGSSWSFRRSGRCSRRSVKPSADPTLVRTRHLPLLLARGKSPRPRPSWPEQRRGSKRCRRCSGPTHHSPPRDDWLHPAEETQHTKARPVLTRQNNRFWMSATSRTIIVRGVPNGGDGRPARSDSRDAACGAAMRVTVLRRRYADRVS